MRLIPILAALTLALAAGPALAADSLEPNDTRDEATPLEAGASFDLVRDAPSDVDYFVFYAPGGRRIEVSITNTVVGSSCQDFIAVLQDEKGKELNSARPGTGDTGTIEFRKSKAARYFLRVSDLADETCPYRLQAGSELVSAGCYAALGPREKAEKEVKRLQRLLKRAKQPKIKARHRKALKAAKAKLAKAEKRVAGACPSGT
jgi:hypothetical protein